MLRPLLFLFAFLALCNSAQASVPRTMVADSATLEEVVSQSDSRPNPLRQIFRMKKEQHKRAITAALAFPFPFGIVGLHRIYLGTAPYVPVVYIATFGGALGILPLIDFFAIVFDKNFDRFVNNGQVFMWMD